MNRCPNCLKAETLSVSSVFKAYRMLKNHNEFPVAGGSLAQTSYFIAAVDFIDFYSATSKKERAELLETKDNGKPQ